MSSPLGCIAALLFKVQHILDHTNLRVTVLDTINVSLPCQHSHSQQALLHTSLVGRVRVLS